MLTNTREEAAPRSRGSRILMTALGIGAVAALFTGAFGARASADTVSIDFEDLTHNRLFGGDRYLDRGVRFVSDTGLFRAFGDFSNTDTPDIHVFEQLGRAIDMRFTTPVDDLAFSVVDGSYLPEADWSAIAYDEHGGVLSSLVHNGGFSETPFRVTFADLGKPIARMVFTPSTDGEAIDSILFTPTSIVVPAQGATSAAALFALLRSRRPTRSA